MAIEAYRRFAAASDIVRMPRLHALDRKDLLRENTRQNHAHNATAGVHSEYLERVMTKQQLGLFLEKVDAERADHSEYGSTPYRDLKR